MLPLMPINGISEHTLLVILKEFDLLYVMKWMSSRQIELVEGHVCGTG